MKSEFEELINWSKEEFYALPWRQNRTLYTTLVSEIMLQQTTVGTVLNHYSGFLKQFPDLTSLTEATEDEMRLAWKGLGYYRRAANLLKAANALKDSAFPEKEEDLQKIPGIGPYTASAIRAIGHNLPALAVDGNLKRVLSRFFSMKTPYEKGLDDEIRKKAVSKDFKEILTANGSRQVNEALMDLGRTICRAKNPLCLTCPLNKSCKAYKSGTQTEFPVRIKKDRAALTDLHLARYLCLEDNKILLYKKIKGEWLEGQWELPTSCIQCKEDNFKQYPQENKDLPKVKALKTGITRYKIQNYPVSSCKKEILENIPVYKKREMQFFPLDDLPHVSTASTKILKKMNLI